MKENNIRRVLKKCEGLVVKETNCDDEGASVITFADGSSLTIKVDTREAPTHFLGIPPSLRVKYKKGSLNVKKNEKGNKDMIKQKRTINMSVRRAAKPSTNKKTVKNKEKTSSKENTSSRTCAGCGAVFEIVTGRRGKPRTFCFDCRPVKDKE
jgi:hypothetical protein